MFAPLTPRPPLYIFHDSDEFSLEKLLPFPYSRYSNRDRIFKICQQPALWNACSFVITALTFENFCITTSYHKFINLLGNKQSTPWLFTEAPKDYWERACLARETYFLIIDDTSVREIGTRLGVI